MATPSSPCPLMPVPTPAQFRRGYRAFQRREKRDAMYTTASFLLSHFWGRPAEMADGLGVLLLTWNQAFYRYGPFSFYALERCLRRTLPNLEALRQRSILSWTRSDRSPTRQLFGAFLKALRIAEGTKRGTQSPVAVAKALHLLAPGFFPLWDDKIARAYGCHYSTRAAPMYVKFCEATFNLATALHPKCAGECRDKTLLKLIDEYNYARFTKGWI